MLDGLVENEIVTHEQLLKIEKYIIDNQKAEGGKMSQKRAPDETSGERSYLKVKKTMENAKVNSNVVNFQQEKEEKTLLPEKYAGTVDLLLSPQEQENGAKSLSEVVPYDSLSPPEDSAVCLYRIISHLLESSKSTTDTAWKADKEFLYKCRQLSKHDSALLSPLLPSIFVKLCSLCNSFRSVVAKEAVMAVGELFKALKVDFDQSL